MAEPGPAVHAELDRLVHEPGRLAILTVLSAVADADFLFLQRATGLTKGNLSSHLSKLEDAGLVRIDKRFVRKKPQTTLTITATGRERTARHWEQLEALRDQAVSVSHASQSARRSSAPSFVRPA
jgi:DNA-binding transcriptional ArsR family regulator